MEGEECEVLSIGVPTRWGIWIVGSGVRMPAGRLSARSRSASVTELHRKIMLTDDEFQSLVLVDALTPLEEVLDRDVVLDATPADALPVDEGTNVGRQVALLEHVVRDVSKTADVRGLGQADTLRDGLGAGLVQVVVAEPQSCRGIVCRYR